MTAPSVLVVDDDLDTRRLLVVTLNREGFRCRAVASGAAALLEVQAQLPDLIVLDLIMPEMDGLEVCWRLRADAATAGVPVIMLTARVEETDRVAGLEMGADDYVVKPFSVKELVARMRAVLRRMRPGLTGQALRAGRLSLDPARHTVEVSGTPVVLTRKEFDLLHTLLEAAGRVLSREHLLRRVWGYTYAGEIASRTVDVHVRRLRAKLGDEGRRITTIKGVGYRFDAD